MKFMEKKIVLKSCSESEYPDLEVTCKYIKNKDIASYLLLYLMMINFMQLKQLV